MKRPAFMTIEVLIALIIISMGIITVTASIKSFYASSTRQSDQETLVMTLLSLKDSVNTLNLETLKRYEGHLNGFDYSINIEQITTNQTYVIDPDGDDSGNHGPFEIFLYKITLILKKDHLIKKINFYQTRYKKRFIDEF